MILTEKEFNVLEKIASKSGMDCWFQIAQKEGDNPYDYVFDLDGEKEIPLAKGVTI
jgi:hypothetical protein